MALKIKFRALLTLCGDPIENGELIIDDGKIVEISTQPANKDRILKIVEVMKKNYLHRYGGKRIQKLLDEYKV